MAATTRSKRNLRSAISTPRKQPTSSRSSSSLSPSPSSSTSSSPSPSPSPPPPSSRTRTSRRTKPKASQNPYKRKSVIVASAPTVLQADEHVVMRSPGGSNKLRPVSHELESWSDSDHTTVYSSSASTSSSSSTTATLREDHDFHDSQPLDLDDPWGYTFQPGDPVWVRTVGGNWYPGKITCQMTRIGRVKEDIDGFYYPAVFSTSSNSHVSSSPLKSLKLRKYFAPMNGEIKPDTSYIRSLLSRHGWVSAT